MAKRGLRLSNFHGPCKNFRSPPPTTITTIYQPSFSILTCITDLHLLPFQTRFHSLFLTSQKLISQMARSRGGARPAAAPVRRPAPAPQQTRQASTASVPAKVPQAAPPAVQQAQAPAQQSPGLFGQVSIGNPQRRKRR